MGSSFSNVCIICSEKESIRSVKSRFTSDMSTSYLHVNCSIIARLLEDVAVVQGAKAPILQVRGSLLPTKYQINPCGQMETYVLRLQRLAMLPAVLCIKKKK